MLLLRSRTFKGFESHRDAEFQCMFWCMFAVDITASLCDILQSRSGAQIFCHVWVMRIRALTCGLLQHSEVWTQNPPSSLSWGFDSPSRHQPKVSKYNKLRHLYPSSHFAPFLPMEGWCMLGVVTPATSCDLRIR